jgi:hypothetical protein
LKPLHQAILNFNNDPTLRQTVLDELMNSIKHAALWPHLTNLDRYIALWHDCLRQYESGKDKTMFRQATSLGNQLVADLTKEFRSKNWDKDTLDRMTAAINKLRSQQ